MRMVDLIIKKRDKKNLTKEEIYFIVNGYTINEIPDYQISSFLMASYLNGLSFEECANLTNAMRFSGVVPDFGDLFTVDKHSTGGVGDKLSFIMAPIFAAAGGYTPMTSGRGLGHTGGTLDKLESIPGMNVNLSLEKAIKILQDYGLFYIGQTKDLAPADKKIYALRDVTGTVESKELITASILSKKYAKAIVFDIKCGNGAFMKNLDDAKALAQNLCNVAKFIPMKATALITNMNQPLGFYVGNALEIHESVEVLKGKYIDDLVELSLIISAHMLILSNISKTYEEAYDKAKMTLESGKALDAFLNVISAQGGDIHYLEQSEKLFEKTKIYELKAERSGYINEINTYNVGKALIYLGGGRNIKSDIIDHSVGFQFLKKKCEYINKNDPLLLIYHNNKNLENVIDILKDSIHIDEEKPTKESLIYETY
jgi:pyrimidine-nucleoside phosphorylase